MTSPQLKSRTPTEPRKTNIIETEVEQEKEIVDQEKPENIRIFSTPFPKRLTQLRPMVSPDFDILGELRNLCIKLLFCKPYKTSPSMPRQLKNCVEGSKQKEQRFLPLFMW